MSTPRTYPHGVPCWIDIETVDPEATEAFYGPLFGWTFARASPPDAPLYTVISLDGRDVGGLSEPEDEDRGWNTYIAVDDADAAAARVTAAGGTLIIAPIDIGPPGHWALCADPSGARFRLWQAGRRLGSQVVNEPGSWNFSNLRTDDPAAAGFYADVFGWELQDLGFASVFRRLGYGDHLEATADPEIRARQREVGTPDGFEDAIAWLEPAAGARAHWHVLIAVADRDAVAQDALRLGGEVLAGEDSRWTRTAVLRDPLGAELTVSQFTP